MNNVPDMRWFAEARFGMFVHWGLYAIPAGTWNGLDTPWVGEWIMRKFKIPRLEYAKFAEKFNPVDFNAREWGDAAKEAGMKYMVITAKHHDGFSMYRSRVSAYNIVDATPFKRDPLEEIAEACREAGIRLGFYYSQDQDWYEPGGSGNDWDFPTKTPEAFANYLASKVKPQLKELLTNYGPIGLIWFDTPVTITAEQSKELKDWVRAIQPDCLVSGRVGHSLGDYESLGDNQIPGMPLNGVWEGLGTINGTWGYKAHDRQWKSTRKLIRILGEFASKGTNYLLNVGPDATGKIPPPCVRRLREVGKWLRVNGDAVYATSASPWNHEFPWGRITTGKDKMYLWLFDWPGRELFIYGLRNPVKEIGILAAPETKLDFSEQHLNHPDYHKLTIRLPDRRRVKPVTILEIKSANGKLDINQRAYGSADF